jgi:hypothetical protein
VYLDNRQLEVRKLHAHSGATVVEVDGRLDLPAPHAANRIDIKVRDLLLDRRLEARLPAALQRPYRQVNPSGPIDASGAIVLDEEGHWTPRGWVLTAKHCRGAHEKFPYPVTDIVGTIVQEGERFRVDLQGMAGARRGRLTGTVINRGPEAESRYVVEVNRLPVNDTLLAAAAAQPPLHRTLSALKLRGLIDARGTFYRPPGPSRKIEWELAASVADGSLEYEHFPYRIADLAGRLDFHSRTGEWRFQDLHGSHGAARLQGLGTFVKRSPAERGTLKLAISAQNAPLENDLRQAFSPVIQRLWDLLSPAGKVEVLVGLDWSPGTKPTISVPRAVITEGSLAIRTFPYSLEHVTAQLSYSHDPAAGEDRVFIDSFEGRHDETRVRIERPPAGRTSKSVALWSTKESPAEWRVRLDPLYVDDLVPDRTFRRALPPGLRSTVQALNPQGKASLAGMIELRGTERAEDPVTAGWNFNSVLAGGSIVTGIELKNVFGSAESRGTWDGANIRMAGRADLDSVTIWNHQFTHVHGPFELENQELTVGSPKAFEPVPAGAKEAQVAPRERLQARAIGGQFYLDAKAHLDASRTTYRVKAAMADGRLEEYARQYLRAPASLKGRMRGWLELYGSGPEPKDAVGNGQLLINPAALYELPVFVQIFKAFSFAPPDKTAFKYALTTFNVANRQVYFREIDLIGDAISLRGRGQAGFDGALRLDFYSRPPRNPIPLVGLVMDSLMQGWVGVRVTGTVQQPRAEIRAVPQIDAALRQFLMPFNPRPGNVPPQLTPWMVPPLGMGRAQPPGALQ